LGGDGFRFPCVFIFVETETPFCSKDRNSQPNRTETEVVDSAMDFSNGSSVYCEMSW